MEWLPNLIHSLSDLPASGAITLIAGAALFGAYRVTIKVLDLLAAVQKQRCDE